MVPHFTLEDLVELGGDYDDPVVHLWGKFMMPLAEKVFKKPMAWALKYHRPRQWVHRQNHQPDIVGGGYFARMGMTNFEAIQSAGGFRRTAEAGQTDRADRHWL